MLVVTKRSCYLELKGICNLELKRSCYLELKGICNLEPGAKICRGFEGQKSRCRDKPKCQKSRHCRGKNRKNRGDIAAKIVKIAALLRPIS